MIKRTRIKIKLQKCEGCKNQKPIFSHGKCEGCARPSYFKKVTKRTKIKSVGKKRAKENRTYTVLKKQFLIDHPLCVATLNGCLKYSSEIHHKKGRIGDLFLDTNHWLECCNNCHREIEAKPVMAKSKGLSESRLAKT